MLNDAEMDDLRWKADLIGGCVPVRPEELRELLDEIARLRAEIASLECVVGLRGDVIEKYEAETARLRSALDARPDISADDARMFMRFKPVPARDSREGPVMHALRAHARKAVKP